MKSKICKSIAIFVLFTSFINVALADLDTNSTWIVDPNNPGANLPPVGHSLFDYLVTKTENGKIVYDIPFPYSALINKIETLVQSDSKKYSAVKQVLIPLGRSLARNIARPDFFRFPRVVAATDTQPQFNQHHSGILLKDRLYIGYGEAAETLEIISYNEAAGRFEFQIVTDYKPDGQPRLFYANREVCSACHQNGALIFSRQQWDETNANPQIATLLKQQHLEFYGVAVSRGVDVPFAIDTATDRANYFALYQLLWQQGCEPPKLHSQTTSHDKDRLLNAIQCRANLLTYTLQFLLSNGTAYDDQSQYYRNTIIPTLTRNWTKHWSNGLSIPDPDIPNRNPLLMLTDNAGLRTVEAGYSTEAFKVLNTMLAKNDVPSAFEPLNPRAPREIWYGSDSKNIEKLVTGLASFIARTDILRIDHWLQNKAASSNPPKPVVELSCQVDDSLQQTASRRIKFYCKSENDTGQAALELRGRFYLTDNQWQHGKLNILTVNGHNQFNLQLEPLLLNLTGDIHSVNLKLIAARNDAISPEHPHLSIRLPNGNAIQSFTLQWPNNPNNQSIIDLNASAQLTIVNDFSYLQQAITSLVEQTENQQTDALANKPFRRVAIMQALNHNLEMPMIDWCCLDDSEMPKAALQDPDNSVAIVSEPANSEIAPFYHYCSACHRTSTPYPPNFLQGNAQQVTHNIVHCAQRIFYRLSMWQFEESKRTKSPMPPATALHNLGFTHQRWATSNELISLKHTVAQLIRKQTGNAPDLEQYAKTGFDNLRSCLPES